VQAADNPTRCAAGWCCGGRHAPVSVGALSLTVPAAYRTEVCRFGEGVRPHREWGCNQSAASSPSNPGPEWNAGDQLSPRFLPPLLTKTHRYDRSGRKISMKSTPASPCQRGGRRFEPGLVLQNQSPVERLARRGFLSPNVSGPCVVYA
jgi:hypothetical protein